MTWQTIMSVAVCICVSLVLLRNLWLKQNGPVEKKLLWSIIVCIPLIGWLFYGGFYNPPRDNPIKAKGGASGWKPWMK